MATNSKHGTLGGDMPFIHQDCDKMPKLAQPVPNIVDDKHSDEINIKNGKGFLFDVVVVRLDIPNKTIDESSKLLVDANFNGRHFSITSSRINVLDFRPERSIEFVANPLQLKEQLSKNPLSLKVSDKDNVIGYGSFEWPKEYLSGLIECAGEMVNSFEVELKQCDGSRTGAMQVLVRLQPKCEEYEEYSLSDAQCRNANKEINPSDVLFVVGEDKKTCCCSEVGLIPASESDHDLQPKCLDLSNFRAINSQNLNNIDILSSLDPASQKLKTISNHYQKLIDAVKTKEMENLDIKESVMKKDEMFYTVPSDSCLKLNVLPSSSDSYEMSAQCPSDNRDFVAKNIVQINHVEDPPELVEIEPKSLRCCPLCKENMEYLPKLAACPNCCYKPIPYFEEKSYDVSQSGDQIVKEYHDNSVTDKNSKQPSKSRCTCKYGSNKACAHCRIRKLCGHIYKAPAPTIMPADIPEPKSSDLNCVSSSENRPFLTRIFSELKDLYNIEDAKEKQFEVDERSKRELNKVPIKKNHLPMKKELNAKAQTVETAEGDEMSKPQNYRKRRKRSVKPASKLTERSRLYDYQLVRQNFATQIGHKTCINGFAGRKNVPPNMGWLWNIHNSGKWKPGAIRKPIKELMRYFLKDFPADTLLVSEYCYRKMSKSKNMKAPYLNTLVQKPTLHIHKKNGEYIITMRPLKPPHVLKEVADPYENMKPVQFRIVKNPYLMIVRNLKKYLKSIGFKKCTCHRPITFCYCRSFDDKKELEYQCNKECLKRQMEPCCDTLVLSDTSDSEAEFDFGVTPPVGIIKPEKLKKVNLVNVSTQYDELDWSPVPLFPRPPNKYMQNYQCAVRERKTKHVVGGSSGTGVKGGNTSLRRRSCPKRASGVNYVKTADRIGNVKGYVGGRPGGDAFLKSKRSKGAVLTTDKEKTENTSNKKVNMLKYVMKMDKKMSKISPANAAAKRKEKMSLLKGANPPVLCMIDRRGKPFDPCAPCFISNDIRIC